MWTGSVLSMLFSEIRGEIEKVGAAANEVYSAVALTEKLKGDLVSFKTTLPIISCFKRYFRPDHLRRRTSQKPKRSTGFRKAGGADFNTLLAREFLRGP